MPTNLLQIRRSTANATVTGLQPGELAFTQASNTLHIGLPDGSGVLRIGGTQAPGILTSNHALVANSTGGIDKVITANLVANSIWANGAAGTAGDVLTSNGTAIYWAAPPAGDITAVTAGSGLTGGGTSGAVTLDVGAGNGISVSADAVAILANSGLVANATGLHIVTSGDTTLIANASGLFVNDATISIATSQLTGDVALGTQTSGNYVATITAGNGISGSGTGEGSTPTIAVVAGTDGGLVSNSSGVFVNANSGLVSNSTGLHVGSGNGISVSTDAIAVNAGSTLTVNTAGVHVNTTLSITSLTTSGDLSVNGNTKLGDATSDVASINARVNTAITPSANVTYDLGENLLRWKNLYSSHVQTVSADVTGNLTVGGDLTVTGNLTTINVSSLSVTDPLIKLAVNNTTGDTLYIGFAGHYNGSGNTNNHTGLFREPTNKNYYLFSTYGDETKVNNNEIIVTDPSFTLANLNAYLLSGGLVTNATHVAITANSTVNVAITANTLTLSTALAGTSGGTGRTTSTNNALLVGNSTNGYNELTLGTSGFVLQSNGTALVYDSIDGGTF